MAVPQSKEQLLAAMDKSWLTLAKKLARVPENHAFEPRMEGHSSGTQMSAANLVSYLIGWGEQVLLWHKQEAAGEEIDFPARGFKWNELGRLAQKFYADYADIDSWPALCTRLEHGHRQLITLIENYSDEALYHQPWYGKWTRGRMIQFNSVSPYANASARLNALLKTLPAET
ncbi:MAG TPA: ClbS/DfsB family four-helix bundle protein [Enterobacteriaceae bacterium]|nr:ClbS/DfsB family four-helix bundle protein [Enterobacteriaceae bacterium]